VQAFCGRDVRLCHELHDAAIAQAKAEALEAQAGGSAFSAEEDQRGRDFGGTLRVVGMVN
jgi:hypothetical protein